MLPNTGLGRIDYRDLKRRCNAVGVDIALGTDFFAESHGGNYIHLNFTLLDETEIRLGIRLLAAQIKKMLAVGRAC